MYQHILISTDGSEIARKGVDHGLALAKSLGAKVTIVTVSESVLPYAGNDVGQGTAMYLEFAAIQKEAAEIVLTGAKEAADRLGVEADTVCLEFVAPAGAIVETADARGCDLIVMSSHGRRGLRRLILGSVTSEVLALASIPVLVVW